MAANRRVARAGTALLLGWAVTQAGCALLIPPSWRARAPMPLAGELPPPASTPALSARELMDLSDVELGARIVRDQERLVELASRAQEGPMATPELEGEVREIAQRLPVLQHEMNQRGLPREGSRIRHPVIR